MKKGFYFLRHNIYYGEYPEDQVSGRMHISAVKPECIKTDVPFSAKDDAVTLCENHALTEQEFPDFEQSLQTVFKCMGITEFKKTDFSKTEERLGVTLPREIKILYNYLSLANEFSEGTERFLRLDELYTDGGNLVFYKIKRTPVGFSLADGTVMNCHKGTWEYSAGGENFFYALNRITVKAICSMPFNKEGKITGALRVALSPEGMLREIYDGRLNILEGYRQYGNIILFNEGGALGWFMSNGFSANILLGSRDEKLFEDVLAAKMEVKWSGSPLKKI